MDYRHALRETMFRFNLKVKDLAAAAGVKETQVSAFRTGKRDLYASTLEKIINAMPPIAQAYFYEMALFQKKLKYLEPIQRKAYS